MRIKSLYPEKLISKNATDFLYKDDMKILCNKNNIDFLPFKGWYSMFVCNFYIIVNFFNYTLKGL